MIVWGIVAASGAESDLLSYTLSPVITGETLEALQVELRFAGDLDGKTLLDMPDRWVGATDYTRYTRDVSFEGHTTAAPSGAARWVLRHEPGTPITVRYTIVSAWDEDPHPDSSRERSYAPIVRPDWFMLYGPGTFARPRDREATPATFTWDGPPNLKFASDLEQLTPESTSEEVYRSVIIGGTALHLASGGPDSLVRLATLGQYAFTDEQLSDLVLRVISAQRSFWGTASKPFLVTMVPLTATPNVLTYSGTSLEDAFALEVATNTPLSKLSYLLAHEHFHTWNPGQIGGMRDGRKEALDYWLSEGFTDFYTYRSLLGAGLLTLEDFVAAWNKEILTPYAGSSVQTMPNRRMVRDFWRDYEVEKLPYQRGALLAAIWDDRLRRQTKGARDLDDVMLAMRDAAPTDAARPAQTAVQRFTPAYEAAGGGDLSPDIARYVWRGEGITLPADVFGSCVTVETLTRARFDPGWDVEATSRANGVVTNLRTDSAAYAAGLRDGMKILAWQQGVFGDSSVPCVLRVSDGSSESQIRFLPQGEGSITLQRLVLSETLTDNERAACTAEVAGQRP